MTTLFPGVRWCLFAISSVTTTLLLTSCAASEQKREAPKEKDIVVEQLADSMKASQDISALAGSIQNVCSGSEMMQECLEDRILEASRDNGPVDAMQVLNHLMRAGTVHGRGDYHDFVHRIGRNAAKRGGLTAEAFFGCPIDYNYACQHGFFEQALIEEPDPVKAATTVCAPDSMGGLPRKFLFYCYHGVGHGIMMAAAYDIPRSLEICEKFTLLEEREGCFQGVFMENVNEMSRKFDETKERYPDPLWPCNTVVGLHQRQCYLNHGAYLFKRAEGYGEAALMCLKAEQGRDDCLQSLGLMSTNPGWQHAIIDIKEGETIADRTVRICNLYPEGYVSKCIFAGVDNMANMEGPHPPPLIELCMTVADDLREACFERLGSSLMMEFPPSADANTICHTAPPEHRQACIRGAGTR